MDIVMNERMQNILSSDKNRPKTVCFNYKELPKLFVPKLVNIYGCIIINNSEEEIVLSAEQFEKVIKMSTDRTGYEALCNDTELNYYFAEGTVAKAMLETAFTVGKCWAAQIKNFDKEKEHCIIISVSDEKEYPSVTMRFHSIWPEEMLWINGDINARNDAVAYFVF